MESFTCSRLRRPILVNWSLPHGCIKISFFFLHVSFHNSYWKTQLFNWVMSPFQCQVTPLNINKRLWKKRGLISKKEKNAELKKPTNQSLAGWQMCCCCCYTQAAGHWNEWPLAWLNKELFPWAAWPLKVPSGQWGSSVGRRIHPLLQYLISATKFSNHSTATLYSPHTVASLSLIFISG